MLNGRKTLIIFEMILTDYNSVYRYITTIRKKTTIFVDYFDTLVKTIVDPNQINLQLFTCILNKYSGIQGRYSIEDLNAFWRNAILESRKFYDDAPWDVLMGYLYENIGEDVLGVDCSTFTKYCYDTYVAIIIGTQYLNRPIYKLLNKAKLKGIKIYLVSDFWLPIDAYELFLSVLGVRELFDGLYISSTLDKSKFRGTIYPYLLRQIRVRPKDVVMIGDNKYSDVKNALIYGIKPLYYLNITNKLSHRYNIKKKRNNPLKSIEKKIDYLHHDTAFSAYSIGFYYFCRELYNHATQDNIKSLCFLSRDGLLLKTLFDTYQNICIPTHKHIVTNYVVNSRIVNKKAKDAKEICDDDYVLFKEYLSSFSRDNVLAIVDNGWKCTSQLLFSQLLSCKTIGYYIGVNKKERPSDSYCVRNGLLFDIDIDGNSLKSQYYEILSARCKFIYEQLLTNGNGTLVSYYKDKNGKIQFKYADEPSNTLMYGKYISQIQEKIKCNFTGISAWLVNSKFTSKDLASIYLKLILNQSKQDCIITNEIKNHRFELFDKVNGIHEYSIQSDKILKSDLASISFSFPIDILKKPEDFLDRFVGIKRRIIKYPIVLPLFRIIEILYYRLLKYKLNL